MSSVSTDLLDPATPSSTEALSEAEKPSCSEQIAQPTGSTQIPDDSIRREDEKQQAVAKQHSTTDPDNTAPASQSPPENEVQDEEGPQPTTNQSTDSEDALDIKAKPLMENPLDTDHSRILLKAIDELRARKWGLYLLDNLPQFVVVGEQSAGKSSLLHTLTGIPFPVADGGCTRFPIRIVSCRTAPGTSNSFRISVEADPKDDFGLDAPLIVATSYDLSGEVLTEGDFEKALEELSRDHIGIRNGPGPNKRNYVANVVRVELCGPSRGQFSLLDLPGLANSGPEMSEREAAGITKMTEAYMGDPANIIICAVESGTDLASSSIIKMALNKVKQRDRLVGVLTKCDLSNDPGSIVESAMGKNTDDNRSLLEGWFVVRSREETDPLSFNVAEAERELFSGTPWTSLSRSYCGSAQLKQHLGDIYTGIIRERIPIYEQEVQKKIDTLLQEKAALGPPRDSHAERYLFVLTIAHEFSETAKMALQQPGHLDDDSLNTRVKLEAETNVFGSTIRERGGRWRFEDYDTDPHAKLREYYAAINNQYNAMNPRQMEANMDVVLKPVIVNFENEQFGESPYRDVDPPYDSARFRQEIARYLQKSRTSLVQEATNLGTCQMLYRLQVAQWTTCVKAYLNRVKLILEEAIKAILNLACPASNRTAILNSKLAAHLHRMLDETYDAVFRDAESYCRRECQGAIVRTNDPRFWKELEAWRKLRYARFCRGDVIERGYAPSERFEHFHSIMCSYEEASKVDDIHDVVKLYYKISLESFIRHVDNNIVESLVAHEKGPLMGLNKDWVDKLSEADLADLADEDDGIKKQRKNLDSRIDHLRSIYRLYKGAREGTAAAEGAA